MNIPLTVFGVVGGLYILNKIGNKEKSYHINLDVPWFINECFSYHKDVNDINRQMRVDHPRTRIIQNDELTRNPLIYHKNDQTEKIIQIASTQTVLTIAYKIAFSYLKKDMDGWVLKQNSEQERYLIIDKNTIEQSVTLDEVIVRSKIHTLATWTVTIRVYWDDDDLIKATILIDEVVLH